MGRPLQAYLPVLALLGLSGCLLFTDPINRAPEVSNVTPDGAVVRGREVGFTATFHDDEDSQTLDIRWAVFQVESCTSINKASWDAEGLKTTHLQSDLPFFFTPESLLPVCVCVKAKDHRGASSFACWRGKPSYETPVATILDQSGTASGKTRPLCSSVHLVASPARSTFPADDLVTYNWDVKYEGDDPTAKAPALVACAADDVIDTTETTQHRCLQAQTPGTYTVSLSITDKPKEPTAEAVTSKTVEFVIPVALDAPPCLQQTEPDVHARRVLVGSSYQTRTFKVLSVAGDCEQYPPVSGKKSPQFVWSVYDATLPAPQWVFQAYSGDSFPISQATFPNALPGDEIKVRVEVRDQAVQEGYLNGIKACDAARPEDLPDVCCGPGGCGTPNDCIRWTTWTVQFQP